MKKLLFITISFLILGSNLDAQTWFTNFQDAKELAAKNNLDIVLVFQGSDWCAPCIKLDKEVWSTTEFQDLANSHFVMLKADFPRKKTNKLSKPLAQQNAKLAEEYNKQGYFPLAVVLSSSGDVLGKMGYEKITPTAYFEKLKAFEN